MLSSYRADKRGSTALLFALMLPMVLTLVGGTVEFARALAERGALQKAVDFAALAAARAASLADSRTEHLTATSRAIAEPIIMQSVGQGADQLDIDLTVSTEPLEVRIRAEKPFQSMLGGLFKLAFDRVSVEATARIVGTPNICVLALDPSEAGALQLDHVTDLTGDKCAVFSNSSHAAGVKSNSSAKLRADTICSHGGYEGRPKNFDPIPFVDCPSFEDPLPTIQSPLSVRVTIPARASRPMSARRRRSAPAFTAVDLSLAVRPT